VNHAVLIPPAMNEPEPPPIKYPPWVKKEILLPVFGFVLLSLIAGNYWVYRVIQKERRYAPVEYGPMDRGPSTGLRPVGIPAPTNAPTNIVVPPETQPASSR
jgi:hypothetical protein